MPAGTPIEAPRAAPSTAPLARLPTPLPDTAKDKKIHSQDDDQLATRNDQIFLHIYPEKKKNKLKTKN
jgi:hypothetical protein